MATLPSHHPLPQLPHLPHLPRVHDLAAQLQRGDTTSTALTQAALARAQAPDGEGARVFIQLHAQQALAAAAASDQRRAQGQARLSLLDGLPVSVKDLFDLQGELTRAGSVVLQGRASKAQAHAPAMQRLVDAGAVLMGRTNMTEFAFSGLGLNPHYGTPRNPWGRVAGHTTAGRIPGGSSSGAAVSVSDGMAVAGIGSDTGGSLRIPAALCGLTGFKPTARRVPTQGALPLSTSLDSIGAMAPTVACCAAVDAVMAAEPAPQLARRDLRSLRLAVVRDVVWDQADADVTQAVERALSRLSAQGATLQTLAMPPFLQVPALNARGTLAAAEAWAWHRTWLSQHEAQYDPRVAVRIKAGAAMSAADYIDLLQARQAWIGEVSARLHGFDALLMPTVPIVAPTIESLADDASYVRTNGLMLRNPALINFLDGCALSLPCHSAGEAPVGLMLASTALQDHALLAVGLAVEAALAATA